MFSLLFLTNAATTVQKNWTYKPYENQKMDLKQVNHMPKEREKIRKHGDKK